MKVSELIKKLEKLDPDEELDISAPYEPGAELYVKLTNEVLMADDS